MAAFSDFNFGGMKKRVSWRLQDHPKYLDKLGVAVNKGVQALWIASRNSLDTQNSSTGQDPVTGLWRSEYPLPSNVYEVRTVSVDSMPCDPVAIQEFVQMGANKIVASNGPLKYYILDQGINKTLILLPRPQRLMPIQIFGVIGPAPMVNDTDVLPFVEAEADPVESFAVQYLLRGVPGEEVKRKEFYEIWKEDRDTARQNLHLDQVRKTTRPRRN